jgi:hypothetical protein
MADGFDRERSLDQRLAALTHDATRGVAVPPADEVRRRARAVRRGQAVGGGAAMLTVVAIVAVAVSAAPNGRDPVAAPAASSTSVGATPSAPAEQSEQDTPLVASSAPSEPSPEPSLASPSGPPALTTRPTPIGELIPNAALITRADLGRGWSPAKVVVEDTVQYRYNPCQTPEGEALPESAEWRSRRLSGDPGELIQHVVLFRTETDASLHLKRVVTATEKCGSSGGAVPSEPLAKLGAGVDSLVVRIGRPSDLMQTYVFVVRSGRLVMELQQAETGTGLTERAARDLAQLAFKRVVAAADPGEPSEPTGSNAPDAFVDRPKLARCGTYTVESGPADPGDAPPAMLRCMAEAMRSGTGAELLTVSQDDGGAPVSRHYRAVPGAPGLEIFQVVEDTGSDDAYSAAFTVRRCPQAQSVTELGTCTDAKL